MKIIETFFLFNIAAAQGNSIEGRILKVEEKCGLFMDKALICVPPEVKKSKYTHRLNKVMRDAKWHKVSKKLDGSFFGSKVIRFSATRKM